MNKPQNLFSTLLAIVCTLIFFSQSLQAQTTAFTYQGKLTDGSMAASGNYDFTFGLYNIAAGGSSLLTLTRTNVPVSSGVFTVTLDYGATYLNGSDLYLEISVKPAGSANPSTLLMPRQPITSAPYSVRSLRATTADNAANLNGVAASGYLQTNGSGAGLTNLNATQITTGTLSDAQLSANVARRDTVNTFTGDQTVNGNLTQTGTTANLNLTNGFVASGATFTGAIPASGAGTRMMFYPRKGAFRAGIVDGTQWDDANVGIFSTAMGYNTTASGNYSTAMGYSTTASGIYSTAMGYSTTAVGNSTAMGYNTTASGGYSTAMGNYASTNNQSGSFVYGDFSTVSPVTANAQNSWTIRAAGGYRFFSNSGLTTGVSLSANGGSWTSLSDRNAKDNIISVNPREVLRGVLKLPIATWNYKGQPQYQHIGPMAQDFYATFKVGENDKTITTVDPDGVALAAIQGLNEELQEELKTRDAKIERQQKQLNIFQEQLKQQQKAIDNLRKLVFRREFR